MAERGHQYDSTYRAVTEVVSPPREFLALVYGNSNDGTYNLLAFQVLRSVRRIERIENQFNIANTDTEGFGYFGEDGFSTNVGDAGNDVFRVDTERARTIKEYGFAVPQDGVYVGVQAGDGDAINGLREGGDRDRGFGPDDLPQQGGILSDFTYIDSPTASLDFPMPTTALSPHPNQGIVRIDSEQDGSNNFYFGFNNQSGGQVTIDVTGYGQTYDVRPIEDETVTREILAGEGYARRVLTYGGFGNQRPNLPRDWYDYRVAVGPGELTPGVEA
jgi:hypothetical protein